MAGIDERYRRLVALVMMLCGFVFIFWGLEAVTNGANDLEVTSADLSPDQTRSAHLLRQVLYITLVLTGVFVVGSYLFLRWSRSFRKRLRRKPPPPTSYEDLWQKHQLPEDWDEPHDEGSPPDASNDR